MLGLICSNQINDDEMQIDFEIPDNCVYALTTVNSEYIIAVNLKQNQNIPSKNFVPVTETVNILNNNFKTTFEQYEKSGVVVRKPVLAIGF